MARNMSNWNTKSGGKNKKNAKFLVAYYQSRDHLFSGQQECNLNRDRL